MAVSFVGFTFFAIFATKFDFNILDFRNICCKAIGSILWIKIFRFLAVMMNIHILPQLRNSVSFAESYWEIGNSEFHFGNFLEKVVASPSFVLLQSTKKNFLSFVLYPCGWYHCSTMNAMGSLCNFNSIINFVTIVLLLLISFYSALPLINPDKSSQVLFAWYKSVHWGYLPSPIYCV